MKFKKSDAGSLADGRLEERSHRGFRISISTKMKTPEHRFDHVLAVCLLVVCSISPSHSAAQTQQPSTMVIDGGTASKVIKL